MEKNPFEIFEEHARKQMYNSFEAADG